MIKKKQMTSIELLKNWAGENIIVFAILAMVIIAIQVVFIRIAHRIKQREEIGHYQSHLLELIAKKLGVDHNDIQGAHEEIWPPKAEVSKVEEGEPNFTTTEK